MPDDENTPEAPDRTTSRRWTTARRWGVRVGLTLVIIPLAWLLAVNLALWTGLVEALVSGERPRSTIRLRHGWAWCVWPTRVHVHDLHLEIDAPRWQLELRLPDGETDIELRKLLSRRFETAWIRGHGADLAFSFKRSAGTDPAAVEGVNVIEGFPLPILDEQPPPIPDHRWEIVLGDIEAALDRLQIDAFEVDLDGRLAGSLDVKVVTRFGLPSLKIRVEEGTVHHLDTKVAEDVRGQVALELASYDPQQVQGPPLLRYLSGEVGLTATCPGLEWIEQLGVALPVTLRRGRGSLFADASLTRGVVDAGSQLAYQTDDLRVIRRRGDQASLVLDGQLSLTVQTPATEDEGGGVDVDVSLLGVRARASGTERPGLVAPQLLAAARYARADLVEGPGPLRSASAHLPRFEVTDLGLLGQGTPLRGGNIVGHASAHTTEDDPEVVAFEFGADVEGLDLDLRGATSLRTDGYVRSKGTLQRQQGVLVLGPLHAKLHDLSLDTTRGKTRDDWVEIDRSTLRYRLDTARIDADLHGRAESLRMLLAHLRPGKDLFQRVPDLGLGTDPVDFSLHLERSPGQLLVDVDELDGPPIDIAAAVSSVDGALRAAVFFRRSHIGLVSVGGGSRDISVAVDTSWFEAKRGWVREALGS